MDHKKPQYKDISSAFSVDREALQEVQPKKAVKLLMNGDTSIRGIMAAYSLILSLYKDHESKKPYIQHFREEPWMFVRFVLLLALGAGIALGIAIFVSQTLLPGLPSVLKAIRTPIG